MNNSRLLFFACGLPLAFLASCQKGRDVEPKAGIVLTTFIDAPVSVESRVAADGLGFVAADEIGLYITQASKEVESVGNQIDNLPFTYNGTAWSGDVTKVSLVGTSFRAYGYYPYRASIPNACEIEYSIKTNQSAGIRPDQYLLYGQSVTDITFDRNSDAPTQIALSFSNRLTYVVAEITAPTTFEGKAVSGVDSVWLLDQPATALLNLADGVLSYDPYAESVDIAMHKKATGVYQCLTIPSTMEPAKEYLKMKFSYADGSKGYMYSYVPTASIAFKSNQIYTLKVSSGELGCYTDFVFAAAGGTITADIRTNMSEPYTLTTTDDWITVEGNNVTAAVNKTEQPRMGKVTLSNTIVSYDIAVLQNVN